MIAYLDTQVAVWLYSGLNKKLTKRAATEIERRDLRISPMAVLELEYLFKRKRISRPSQVMLPVLTADFGVTVCQHPFHSIVLAALSLDWTSDPFDRLITAHALANDASPLITSDEKIRQHYSAAVW